ncbi:hypothetical protein [Deinococcus sp. 23YEL01]|nr:hypothetical protein [Deinococcus sp. 23YEL01]
MKSRLWTTERAVKGNWEQREVSVRGWSDVKAGHWPTVSLS